MSECTVRIEPGQPIEPHLAEGAVLCLAPGVHPANLVLTTSVTLQGEPGAILDGQTQGAVVRTEANKLEITLRGLELRSGAAELGSGVLLEGYSKLHIQGCTIAGNSAGRGGGSGLAARRGWLFMSDTTVGPEDEVVITNTAEAEISGSTLQGDASFLDGAKVTVKGGSIAGTLTLRGTTSRAPVVVLEGVEVGTLDNHAELPAELTVR